MISPEFPNFIWTLRDFSTELGLESPTDYLEGCLKSFEERGPEKQQINIIKEIFQRRSCFTLPKPCKDSYKIEDISNLQEEELSTEFREDIRHFLQHMSMNIGPRYINKGAITGTVLSRLIPELVNSLNLGQPPILNLIAADIYRSGTEDNSFESYREEIQEKLHHIKSQLPVSETELLHLHSHLSEDIITKFTMETQSSSSEEMFSKNIKMLKKIMQESLLLLEEENRSRCYSEAITQLGTFKSECKMPNLSERSQFSKEVMHDAKEKFTSFISEFIKNNNSLVAAHTCLKEIPGFMSECYARINTRIIDIYDRKMTDLQTNMNLELSTKEKMKDYVNSQETEVLELTKENQVLKTKMQTMESELNRVLLQLESSKSSASARHSELESTIDSLRSELLNLKSSPSFTTAVPVISSNLLASPTNLSSSCPSPAFQTLAGLSCLTSSLLSSLSSWSSARGEWSGRLSPGRNSVAPPSPLIASKIEKNKQIFLKKFNEIRAGFERRIEELELKLRDERTLNQSLRKDNFEKKRLENELRKKEVTIEEMRIRARDIDELKKVSEEKQQVNQETFTEFIRQIEGINMEKSSLEENLMKFKKQALMIESEMGNVVNCVNTISTRGKDKTLMIHVIKKLSQDSIAKLRPFFGTNKIKV